METILSSVKEEPEPEPDPSSGMVLDATAEFCRTLGDIPTYGQAGNRDHHAEIMVLTKPFRTYVCHDNLRRRSCLMENIE